MHNKIIVIFGAIFGISPDIGFIINFKYNIYDKEQIQKQCENSGGSPTYEMEWNQKRRELLPSSNPVFYSPIRTKRETIVTGAVCLVAGVGLGMMLKDCLDGKKNTPTVRGIGPSDLDFFINDTNPPSIDGHTNNPTCIDKPTGQQSSDNQPVLETNTAETISLSPEKETDKFPMQWSNKRCSPSNPLLKFPSRIKQRRKVARQY